MNFRDKGNEGVIKLFEKPSRFEKIPSGQNNIKAHHIPEILEKSWGETIRTQGFEGTHSKNNGLDFLLKNRGQNEVVIFHQEGWQEAIEKILPNRGPRVTIFPKQSGKIVSSQSTQTILIIDLLIVIIQEGGDVVSTPVDNSKSVKESRILITLFEPLNPRFLFPVEFFFVGVFLPFYAESSLLHMGSFNGVTLINALLDSSQFTIELLFLLEDILEGIFISTPDVPFAQIKLLGNQEHRRAKDASAPPYFNAILEL